MSDRQGVLCLAIMGLSTVAVIIAITTGSLVIAWVGLVIYGVSYALVIRYIAS